MAANAARGLPYEAVKTIDDKLVSGGKPVARITYRDILAETGTGSLETIGNHLCRYRREYVETSRRTMSIRPNSRTCSDRFVRS